MRLKVFRVDAFTDTVYHGNPAAVVPLRRWLDDALMQNIAMENNLSETAFFVPEKSGYHLRWFTPSSEVPLCGHATLAAAYVILFHLQPSKKSVHFRTKSGDLAVARTGELLTMDFPRFVPQRCDPPRGLEEALGARPREVFNTREDSHWYAVFDTPEVIRSMTPDMGKLAALHPHQAAVSARGTEEDFVSRFFAPSIGIPEDPVTGSTHCALIPYWAEKLGKSKLHARQVSVRGGDLYCEDLPDDGRVRISGRAVISLTGVITA